MLSRVLGAVMVALVVSGSAWSQDTVRVGDPAAWALIRRADGVVSTAPERGMRTYQATFTQVLGKRMSLHGVVEYDASATPCVKVHPLLGPGEKPWREAGAGVSVADLENQIGELLWMSLVDRLRGCELRVRTDDGETFVVVERAPRGQMVASGHVIRFGADGTVASIGSPDDDSSPNAVTLRYLHERFGDALVEVGADIEGWGDGAIRVHLERVNDVLVPVRRDMMLGAFGSRDLVFDDVRVNEPFARVPGRIDASVDELLADLATDLDRVTMLRVLGQLERRAAIQGVTLPVATASDVLASVLARAVADAEVRDSTLRILSRMGDAAAPAVPTLVDLLGSEDEAVALAAARVLGSVGAAAAPAVPRVVELMDERPQLVVALRGVGAAAAPAVAKLRAVIAKPWPEGGPDPVAAPWAVAGLADIGAAAESAMPELVDLLSCTYRREEHPKDVRPRDLRLQAAKVLAGFGAAAAPRLRRVLLEPDVNSSRTFAGHATAALGENSHLVTDELIRRLGDKRPDVRAHAGGSLARCGVAAAPARDGLLNMLRHDEDPYCRLIAAWALGAAHSGDREAAQAVLAAWRDGTIVFESSMEPRGRTAVERTLVQMAQFTLPGLAEVLRTHPDRGRREQAGRILGRFRTLAVKTLTDAARSDDESVAIAAIHGLHNAGLYARDAAPLLAELLGAASDAVADAAADALTRMPRVTKSALRKRMPEYERIADPARRAKVLARAQGVLDRL